MPASMAMTAAPTSAMLARRVEPLAPRDGPRNIVNMEYLVRPIGGMSAPLFECRIECPVSRQRCRGITRRKISEQELFRLVWVAGQRQCNREILPHAWRRSRQ